MAGTEAPNPVKGAWDRLAEEQESKTAWGAGLDMGLSSALSASEEQRLQISRELVEQQIVANQLRGEQEAEMFELKREVLRLESRVLGLEQRHRHSGGAQTPAQSKSGAQGEEPRAPELQAAALGRQLQDAREAARAAGQRLAVQTEVLSASQEQLRQAEAENSRLQLHVKRLGEECALRLQSCARRAAELSGGAGPAPDATALRAFLESALEDIRAAHRGRELQLARAARAYRKRLAELSRRHQELLGVHSLQPSLEGAHATVTASTDLELPQHLQEQKGPSEASLRTAEPRGLDTASWAYICQKLQDFSHGTQAELERERAQLLVRATTAEGRLSELQEYVDQHLSRYRQEILRLRALLGAGEPREENACPPGKAH